MSDNRIKPAMTGPLVPRRTDSVVNDPGAPPAVAGIQAATRDTAKTGRLNPDRLPPEVDLEQLNVPEPPAPPEHHGFWDKVSHVAHSVTHTAGQVVHKAENLAHDAVQSVEHVAEVGAEIATAGIKGVVAGAHQGHGVLGSLSDGAHAAGNVAFKEAADPILTHAIGKADKAHDAAAGALGPLLTNRLAVGDSVDIKIEAGATIPTELVGAPNIRLGGGGTLKIKRVAALDENNQPILKPDGTPQTRLEVELKAEGRAGGVYTANAGVDAKISVAGYDVGAAADVRAEAEGGYSGSLDLKLRFDPDNPQDMGDLLAMTKATAATGAAATMPGLGALIAGLSASDYKRSLDSLGRHLEEVGGTGGLYAQVTASQKLGVGIFKAAPAGGGAAPVGLGERAANVAEDTILSRLKLNLINFGASTGGDAKVGVKRNFRTGDTVYSFEISGAANATAGSFGGGASKRVGGNRTVNLVFGKDGSLKDITVQQSLSKAQFQGAMTTVADIYGRAIEPGVIAGLQESDTIQMNYHIKPELVARVRDARDLNALTEAAVAVGGAAITKDRFKLDPGDIIADHREQVNLSVNLGAAFGGEIRVRGGVTLGHDQERVIK